MIKLVVNRLLELRGMTFKDFAKRLKISYRHAKIYEKSKYRGMSTTLFAYMGYVLDVPCSFLERMIQYDKFSEEIGKYERVR